MSEDVSLSSANVRRLADPSVNWLLAFQACNACNFTIGLGTPLILTARYLGAGKDLIGLLNGVAPLMVCLQLFSTNYMERLGYRRMMLMGWSTRSFMLLLIVPLPFLVGMFSSATLAWALVIPVVLFNFFRGLASGAWLPWLRAILPEGERGRYLAREQVTMNLSGFMTLQLCGMILGTDPGPFQYAILFIIAWAAGMASVYFLKKAPDVIPRISEDGRGRSWDQIWIAAQRIWKYRPFRTTTVFSTVYTFAVSAIPGFLVVYTSEDLSWKPGDVVMLQSASTVGVLLTALFWGGLSERFGSRPVLRVALVGQLILVSYWAASSMGAPIAKGSTIIAAYALWGALGAAQAISLTRLTLGSSPAEDVTLAMPIYQVFIAFAGGGAPLIWGYLLEAMNVRFTAWDGPGSWPFLIFFLACNVCGLVSYWLLCHIREPDATSTRKMLMGLVYDWPVQLISAVLVRRK